MKKLFLLAVLILTVNSVNAQWEPDVRLTNDPAKSYIGGAAQVNIASTGDTVHVVWYDARNGNWGIFYKHSTDGGLNWGSDTPLTSHFGKSRYPTIALNGSIVHVAWGDDRDDDDEIYYIRSTDGGNTWEQEKRLTDADGDSYSPCMAVSGNDIHVTWHDERDSVWEIYYKRSTDGGVTWEEDVRLTNNPAWAFFSSVAASGQNVVVVWSDYREEYEQIYSIRSTDAGATWGEVKALTDSPGYSDYPSISASGNLFVVAWYDMRSGVEPQICYIRSTDAGATWETDTVLNEEPGYCVYANVSVSGSGVHVVWDNNSNIYYKCSKDGGLTWKPDVQFTNYYISSIPSVSASGSAVHVIWNDKRDGETEIYYKRNPIGNIIGIEDNYTTIGQQISVYPNPASEYIEIEARADSRRQTADGKLQEDICIYNMLGECVSNSILNFLHTPNPSQEANGEGVVRIDISQLPVGMYFIVINSGKNIDRKKFVIMR
ncbi:MAG: exo-alpha-sialidase [bacterium]